MEKIKWVLYLSAIVLVIIPLFIVFISDITFSSTFSNTVIITSIVLIILGKLITVSQKRQEIKNTAGDLGIIIGLLLVILFSFF